MAKTIITADSTCDLSAEIIEKHGVKILPLYVVLGERSYRDSIDIKPDDIYDYVSANNVLPKTSAGSVDDYLNFFKKLVENGNEVVHFNISSEMSSSYQNACIAASEVGNVYVVDSRNLSTGSGLLVLDAVEMANEGIPAEQIAEKMRSRTPLVRASFVVDKLEYLHKGGRCTAVALLGANLLKIKPRIEVNEGKMGMGGKYRGAYKKVLTEDYVKDVLSVDNINTKRVFITHTKCDPELVQAVIDKVNSLVKFDEVYETTAGCVITSHCGANTIGVLYEVKE